ncbi:hypothetical protein [Streptomyces sp. NPDC001809]
MGIDERDRHQQPFEKVQSIIEEQIVLSRAAGALYRAAARIPGVVVVPASQETVGRTGIALARLDEQTGERTELSSMGRPTITSAAAVSRSRRPAASSPARHRTRAVLERATVTAQKERPSIENNG